MNTNLDMSNMTSIDQIGEAIREILTRDTKNRAEWVALKLDLCELFFKAKLSFNGDLKKFGKWKKEHFSDVSEQDSAAYVGMGEDIDWATTVLNATELKSIQRIYAKEFKDQPERVSKGAHKGKTREQAKADAKAAAAPAPVKPVFTNEEYNFLKKMVAPDRIKHTPSIEDLTRALQLLNDHKKQLCQPKPKQEKPAAQPQPEQTPEAA
jgi:hypothetical protein